MDWKSLLASLGEEDCFEAMQEGRQEFEATLPATIPAFLTPARFRVSREWAGLEPEMDRALEAVAQQIVANPALLYLARHGYRLLYEETGDAEFRKWPALERALPGFGGVFYLLLVLDAVPKIRAVHQARGVPEAITRATCGDIGGAARRHRRLFGEPGMERRMLPWFRNWASGEIHRLGRFQYMLRSFHGRLEVYRNRRTGRTLALSAEGIRFNREGYIDKTGSVRDTKQGWTSRLVREEDTVTGSPLSPYGMALPQETTLSLHEWARVLTHGDPVLEMHIPDGEPMPPEACLASMQQALTFFPQVYPNQPFHAFACYSWIFNTQLEQMLPPTANLVQFQREPYLFPLPFRGKEGVYYVFHRDEDEFDLATAPRDSTLQRAYAARLEAGQPLRGGGCFLLMDDLAAFGTQLYRSQWPALALAGALTNADQAGFGESSARRRPK